MVAADLAAHFEVDGYLQLADVFSPQEVEQILRVFGDGEIRGGIRNVLEIPEIQRICRRPEVQAIVSNLLSPGAFAVRGILFDKNSDANWALDFHRDVKIAVKQKVEVGGYGSWSVKDGVVHVQPPIAVLERQLAFRIALDSCSAENGPVVVIPGSHAGRQGQPITCVGEPGSVLVFKSLLLHRSGKATTPARRRVLHIEFCDCELESGLEWNWRFPIHD
jgi:ectoine hydroxylase-related dioxygenase (phytanoyl-CoA dioxygenase family)